MRTAVTLVIWIVVSWPAFGADPGTTPPLSPLFDGKSLAGWAGNLQAFRIQDGAIVGGQLDKPVPRNEYLCTTKVYRDFELRLKFRLRGENVNAGVQFRSERVPGSNEMIGYQADMGQHYWGCLYDERRHKLLAGPTKEEQQKMIRRDDWNDYVIRAEGRHVQLWLNGQKTVDYTEPDATIPQEGVFGLQIHQGAPSEAWYKDIMIQLLPDKPHAKQAIHMSITLIPSKETSKMDTLEAIRTRRSIRQYLARPVPQDLLQQVLTAAMYAPSACNQQPWQFVVIEDRTLLREIPKINSYAAMASEAPVAILVCGDSRLETVPGYWVIDCSAAVQNLLLAAHAVGLGAVWTGVYPQPERVEGFRRLLGLPKTVTPHSLVPLGYPAEQPPQEERYRADRVHHNGW